MKYYRLIRDFAFIAAAIIAILSIKRCNTEAKNNKDLSKQLEYLNEDVVYLRTENGAIQAEKHASLLTIEQLQATNSNLIREIDGLKTKNIESINETTTITSDTLFIPVRDTVVDSTESLSFTYKDKWLSLNGLVNNRSALITYSIKDSINTTTYWKRTGMFKRKELFVNVESYNKNTSVVGVRNVAVKQPAVSRLGFGGNISYGVNVPLFRPSLHVGFGLQVRF